MHTDDDAFTKDLGKRVFLFYIKKVKKIQKKGRYNILDNTRYNFQKQWQQDSKHSDIPTVEQQDLTKLQVRCAFKYCPGNG